MTIDNASPTFRWALFVLVACALAALFLGGCAAEAPRPAPRLVQCRMSNYEICAAKCDADQRGEAFIIENQKDVACYCKKPAPEGT